jgi:nucleoside diphosphate kinase
MNVKTVMAIKPDCSANRRVLSDLLRLVLNQPIHITFLREVTMGEDFWRRFYAQHAKNPRFPDFSGFARWLASAPVIFLIIEGEGRETVALVREQILMPLRRKYKTNERMTAAHASDSLRAAAKEVRLVSQALMSS